MNDRAGARRASSTWVAIAQLLLLILLTLVFVVFQLFFAGEFLIVVRGRWLLYVGLILLWIGTIASVVLALRDRRRVDREGNPSPGPLAPALRSTGVVVWCVLLVGCVLPVLSVGRTLVLGAMGAVPTAALAVLAIPFLGYAVLLGASGVVGIVRTLRHRSPALPRGSALVGGPIVLILLGFVVLIATWHPRWANDVDHSAVFAPGDQAGRAYRIPSMVVLPDDTVVAFAESRQEAMSDLLDIDIVTRRSTDGARTWTPVEVVEDRGAQTVHSPTAVYDEGTATIWLAYCVDYERLWLTSSTDGGRTWAPGRDMSAELGLAPGTYCHNGPGGGVQMIDGRLVIPTNQGEPRVLTSDDHGVTWALGAPMGGGEEPQVWVRADGTLCANLRNAAGSPRLVTCSPDAGATWAAPDDDPNLRDAGTQASILRDRLTGELLFANPGADYRGSLTVRSSPDDGVTWPTSRVLYDGAAGYSQLGVLSDGTLLVMFETGRLDLRESITVARLAAGSLAGS